MVSVGDLPPSPGTRGYARNRILTVLRRGEPDWDYANDRPCGWRRPPGAAPWWVVRQAMGGRVAPEVVAAAVEALMARGELLEVWLVRPDRRPAQHLLLLPGFSQVLRHPVARARGLESVLESEPWYPALRDRQARAGAGIPSATD